MHCHGEHWSQYCYHVALLKRTRPYKYSETINCKHTTCYAWLGGVCICNTCSYSFIAPLAKASELILVPHFIWRKLEGYKASSYSRYTENAKTIIHSMKKYYWEHRRKPLAYEYAQHVLREPSFHLKTQYAEGLKKQFFASKECKDELVEAFKAQHLDVPIPSQKILSKALCGIAGKRLLNNTLHLPFLGGERAPGYPPMGAIGVPVLILGAVSQWFGTPHDLVPPVPNH